jgi:hypothetical protein
MGTNEIINEPTKKEPLSYVLNLPQFQPLSSLSVTNLGPGTVSLWYLSICGLNLQEKKRQEEIMMEEERLRYLNYI